MIFIALVGLFVSLPSRAAILTMGDYLNQVALKHEGLRAARQAEQGALRRTAEGEIPLSPAMFVEGERSLDATPKNFPAAEGQRAERNSVKAGVQKKSSFGTTTKVYYSFSRTDLNGADPNFVRPPSFYQASPVAEVSVDLWRNAFGRETKAGVDVARNRALAQVHAQRLQSRRLLADAEIAYWTLAAARRKERIALESLARAEKLRDWVSDRVRRSLSDKSEGLESDAAARLRALDARSAADDRRQAERAFAALRGGLVTTSDEDLLDLKDEGQNPRRAPHPDDLAVVEYENLALAREAALGVETTRPTVEAYALGALSGRRAASADATSDSFGPTGPKYAVGARVSVPLNVGLLSEVRDGRRREMDAATARKLRKEFESVDDWRDLEMRLVDARARVELTQSIEDAQRARVETERRRQSEGRTTTYFVLQAEQDWAAARRERVNAELGVRVALARMKPYSEE
jgi:outer membrane protein TolC